MCGWFGRDARQVTQKTNSVLCLREAVSLSGLAEVQDVDAVMLRNSLSEEEAVDQLGSADLDGKTPYLARMREQLVAVIF